MTPTRPQLIVIGGPTAIGKTRTAIELAKTIDTEIISADSRQIYRQLKIGVGRPSEQELQAVKHHLIAQVDIEQHYHAGDFERDALSILQEIYKNKSQAIVCGGTGLYIQALCDGMDNMPEINPEIREELNNKFESEGIGFLQEFVRENDPALVEQMDMNNHKRLIRAVEIFMQTGQPYSSFRKGRRVERYFDTQYFCLYNDRDKIRANIEKRVLQMMEDGWIDECKNLVQHRHLKALQTVGYKEIFQHLDEHLTYDETVELIITRTYQYAKRQLTWFRRDERYIWVKNLDEIKQKLK